MIEKLITRWLADVAIRKRRIVFAVFAALTAVSFVLSGNLDVNVNIEDLLGDKNPTAQEYLGMMDSFGVTSTMIIVVEGTRREAMTEAAHRVVDRVEEHSELSELFRSIHLKTEADYPLQWGLMLTDDIEDIQNTHHLLEQRTVLGLMTVINDTIEEVVLDDEDQFATNQDQWNGLAALAGYERLVQALNSSLGQNDVNYSAQQAEADAREIIESVFAGEQYNWSPNQDMLTFSLIPAFDIDDFDSLYRSVKGVEAVLQDIEQQYDDVTLSMGGEIPWTVARHEGASADTMIPTLVALGFIIILFFFSFTRLRKMMLAILALFVGIIITVGGIVLTVGHISLITSIFAVILLGLGIDFAIHLVSNYDDFRLKGKLPEEAMRITMTTSGSPILLGGVTTACAFFSLVLASSPAIREFGLVSGMGVLVILVSMLLLFPALIMSFGGKGELRRARWRPMINFSFMGSLGRGIQKYPLIAIAAALVLTVITAAALPKNEVDFDPMNNSPRSHPITLTQQRIIDTMETSPFISFSRTSSIEEARHLTEAFRQDRYVSQAFSVADLLPPEDEIEARLAAVSSGGSAGPGGSNDVSGLAWSNPGSGIQRTSDHIDQLAYELQRLEWNVIEIGDLAVAGIGADNLVVRRRDHMIREIIGAEVGEPGREVFQQAISAITENPQVAAMRLASLDSVFSQAIAQQQELMTVDRAPGIADIPENLRRQLVSLDGEEFLVTVIPTAETQEGSSSIQAFYESLAGIDPGITGAVPLYVALVDEIFTEAARAGIYVFIMVFVMLMIIFRKVSHVLLSFLMVALGLIWMFGLLPLSGTQLGLTAGLVFPLLIGIGTDDAMHIMHRYRHEQGDIAASLRYTGKAVLLTSVTTMLAFGSLAVVGEMATITAIGSLLFIGIGTCFIATVVVLPACLALAERWKNR